MTHTGILERLASKWQAFRDNEIGFAELVAGDAELTREIAHELGLSTAELGEVATHGGGSHALFEQMLAARGLSYDDLDARMSAVVRDMERVCSNCHSRGRCQREFEHGTAAQNAHEFCPNAPTMDALGAA